MVFRLMQVAACVPRYMARSMGHILHLETPIEMVEINKHALEQLNNTPFVIMNIVHFQPKKETRRLLERGETEFNASELVIRMNSAFCKRYILVNRRLHIGEVYCLAPYLTQSVEPLGPYRTTDNRNVKTRKVKIMMTKEQLQLLLTGAVNFQTKSIVACFRENSGLQGCPKSPFSKQKKSEKKWFTVRVCLRRRL
ncbi:hypothetical protein VNO77_06013 [Canavalia gladiata]|uniref:Uncharacterized protein n=1 Tax=Canavalia gladiata TaxID=3824 RepID=A0AAN9MZC9_CANGL